MCPVNFNTQYIASWNIPVMSYLHNCLIDDVLYSRKCCMYSVHVSSGRPSTICITDLSDFQVTNVKIFAFSCTKMVRAPCLECCSSVTTNVWSVNWHKRKWAAACFSAKAILFKLRGRWKSFNVAFNLHEICRIIRFWRCVFFLHWVGIWLNI